MGKLINGAINKRTASVRRFGGRRRTSRCLLTLWGVAYFARVLARFSETLTMLSLPHLRGLCGMATGSASRRRNDAEAQTRT
jgi:hypothetical protein